MEHPPISPDLAPADYYLFSRLKSSLKGQRFCDATDIKNAMEELKRLSQKEYFQHLYSCLQKITATQGGYFERNIS